jgi:uracil-DNA glycosylase
MLTMPPQDNTIPISIEALHERIRACRRCEADGFPISPPPLAWGTAPAPFMLIGQAPGISDLRGGRMYLGPDGRKLIGWLKEAGFSDDDLGTTVYMTAITKCFPGRLPGKSTDRAPSGRERANCRPWLDQQIEAVQPRVFILFGKMAIDAFLPPMSLTEAIGRTFERDGRTIVPLPHSSGASTWLNSEENRALVGQAIRLLSEARASVLQSGG